jgi:hypothetical protein
LVALAAHSARAAGDGQLRITVVDEETREPVAVRMELLDARGRIVRVRPEGAVVAGDSFYFDGETTLPVRPGSYTFLVEAGPEYVTRPGQLPKVERNADDSAEIAIGRRVDMRHEGWYAGDLDVELPLDGLPLVMRARGMSFAPVAAKVNDHGRCRTLKLQAKAGASATEAPASTLLYGPWATLDYRRGGGLIAVGAGELADVCSRKADEPSLASAAAAHDAGALVAVLSPSAWELPIWIAAGKVDAVQILNRVARADAAGVEAEGRPRETTLFPGKTGQGRYDESIYHHLLNCGLRLPPAAGSGAGAEGAAAKRRGGATGGAMLGSNRVYVHCGDACTRESWLAGLRAGRVVVTNGPLLRPLVEGQPPGEVFPLDRGERREFQVALNLAFYEKTQVEYLEIVKNGRSEHQVRLDELAQRAGRLPPVEFDGSGWFLIRAVTNSQQYYQFASSGPYYVESNYKPRISRASVQYFIDWLDAAAKEFADSEATLAEIESARPFWNELLAKATDD